LSGGIPLQETLVSNKTLQTHARGKKTGKKKKAYNLKFHGLAVKLDSTNFLIE